MTSTELILIHSPLPIPSKKEEIWYDPAHQHTLFYSDGFFYVQTNSIHGYYNKNLMKSISINENNEEDLSLAPKIIYQNNDNNIKNILCSKLSLDKEYLAIQSSPYHVYIIELKSQKSYFLDIKLNYNSGFLSNFSSTNDVYIIEDGIIWSDHNGGSQDLLIITNKGIDFYKASIKRNYCKFIRTITYQTNKVWYNASYHFFYLYDINYQDTSTKNSSPTIKLDGFFLKTEKSTSKMSLELKPPDRTSPLYLSSCCPDEIFLVNVYYMLLLLVQSSQFEDCNCQSSSTSIINLYHITKTSQEKIGSLFLPYPFSTITVSVNDNLIYIHHADEKKSFIYDIFSLSSSSSSSSNSSNTIIEPISTNTSILFSPRFSTIGGEDIDELSFYNFQQFIFYPSSSCLYDKKRKILWQISCNLFNVVNLHLQSLKFICFWLLRRGRSYVYNRIKSEPNSISSTSSSSGTSGGSSSASGNISNIFTTSSTSSSSSFSCILLSKLSKLFLFQIVYKTILSKKYKLSNLKLLFEYVLQSSIVEYRRLRGLSNDSVLRIDLINNNLLEYFNVPIQSYTKEESMNTSLLFGCNSKKLFYLINETVSPPNSSGLYGSEGVLGSSITNFSINDMNSSVSTISAATLSATSSGSSSSASTNTTSSATSSTTHNQPGSRLSRRSSLGEALFARRSKNLTVVSDTASLELENQTIDQPLEPFSLYTSTTFSFSNDINQSFLPSIIMIGDQISSLISESFTASSDSDYLTEEEEKLEDDYDLIDIPLTLRRDERGDLILTQTELLNYIWLPLFLNIKKDTKKELIKEKEKIYEDELKIYNENNNNSNEYNNNLLPIRQKILKKEFYNRILNNFNYLTNCLTEFLCIFLDFNIPIITPYCLLHFTLLFYLERYNDLINFINLGFYSSTIEIAIYILQLSNILKNKHEKKKNSYENNNFLYIISIFETFSLSILKKNEGNYDIIKWYLSINEINKAIDYCLDSFMTYNSFNYSDSSSSASSSFIRSHDFFNSTVSYIRANFTLETILHPEDNDASISVKGNPEIIQLLQRLYWFLSKWEPGCLNFRENKNSPLAQQTQWPDDLLPSPIYDPIKGLFGFNC